MKVASFTVGATMDQSIRWKRAAEGEGHRAVGTWLAQAADAYLRVRARAGQPVALAWYRGAFRVVLADGTAVQVRGMISRPFGHYVGTEEGPDGNKHRTLVLLATGQIIATLRTAGQAKVLASELAPALLREDRELAAGVIERHRRESV